MILAQCSVPLTSWARKQPLTSDYLCHICHLQKHGPKEGMIVATWKKTNQTTSSTVNSQLSFLLVLRYLLTRKILTDSCLEDQQSKMIFYYSNRKPNHLVNFSY